MPDESSQKRPLGAAPAPNESAANRSEANAADAMAARYAEWRASRLGRITDALEKRLFATMIGPVDGKRLLDVGCGDGVLAIGFARRGAAVTGVDLDPAMLDAARAKARALAAAEFIEANAVALPFKDEAFDIVYASALLCVAPDRGRIVREIARVMKPGGRVVIGDLGAHSIWNAIRRLKGLLGNRNWRDAHFFTRGELFALLRQAGLKPEAARGAIFYPPSAFAAAAMAGLDPVLGRLTTIGAAFIAAAGIKPQKPLTIDGEAAP